MKFKRFKCILLSDVIINQRAATEGKQESLDFIPGNNFLGIVASEIYPDENISLEEKQLLFHSGKVRFGDAHPALNANRSLRVPSAWFVPKLSDRDNNEKLLLVHHHITDFDEYKKDQPKQCRTGFYCFYKKEGENGKIARQIQVNKNFALKSAYDKDFRRSKDEQLFGYQSLNKGLELIFEINVDDEIFDLDLLKKIEHSIEGIKKIGRSRTAQYGLVKIEELGKEWEDAPKEYSIIEGTVYIYADSRLIFLDDYGNPTFTPKPVDFHLKECTVRTEENKGQVPAFAINWEKSQIRTFQYAPWNTKRQARDVDRCGIEKGSVIVIHNATLDDGFNGFVGLYQNEGFGKVLICPDFLKEKDEKSNGKALYEIENPPKIPQNWSWNKMVREIIELKGNSDDLLFNLGQSKEQELEERTIYRLVNIFIEQNPVFTNHLVLDDEFASQWGTIRALALQHPEKQSLLKSIGVYLTHGVAADKWSSQGKNKILLCFLNNLKDKIESEFVIGENVENVDYLNSFAERILSLFVVNLASEMAKLCRRKKDE